jgi:folate-dependent phosphoribosylglycinamide formyltransferase PurN
MAMPKKRVAVLISGRGSNMASLIAAARDDSYPAEIALVLSNRPDASTTHTKARTAKRSNAHCKTCSPRIASTLCASPASCVC